MGMPVIFLRAKVGIHLSSVNSGVQQFPLFYLVYSEKVKTICTYVIDSTNISDFFHVFECPKYPFEHMH
jgi:hypothetical protein